MVKRHHENGLVMQNGTSVMLQSECCALQKKTLKSLWNNNLPKLSTYTAEVTIHSSLIFQQEYNCRMYRFFFQFGTTSCYRFVYFVFGVMFLPYTIVHSTLDH